MTKCVNPNCGNYKQELDDGLEICPACNQPTETITTSGDSMRKLAPVAAIGSVLSILLTFFLFDWVPNFYVSFGIGVVLIAGCIVFAFITKVRGAIITTIASALGFIGIFFYYGVF
ncbi:MAG: hypothetical protein FWH10_01660 [Oscillospiraceae bacterium]|nr:hypothetical protein [Oscillospiraceae bacterium]